MDVSAEHKGVRYEVAITPVGDERWDWSWSCTNAPLRGRNVDHWVGSQSTARAEAIDDARQSIDQWLEKQEVR